MVKPQLYIGFNFFFEGPDLNNYIVSLYTSHIAPILFFLYIKIIFLISKFEFVMPYLKTITYFYCFFKELIYIVLHC